MKKLVLSLSIVALFLGSCSSDNEEITTDPIPTGTISGEITTAKSYPKGNYTIQGTVKVKNGGSLTIEAGSVITAVLTDGSDALLVENRALAALAPVG